MGGGGVVLAVGAVAEDIIWTRNQKAGSSKPCSDGSLHSVPSGYSQGLVTESSLTDGTKPKILCACVKVVPR